VTGLNKLFNDYDQYRFRCESLSNDSRDFHSCYSVSDDDGGQFLAWSVRSRLLICILC